MKVYVLSSVSIEFGEFQGKTVWGVFKTKEEAELYIKQEKINAFEQYITIDEFTIN